MADFKLTINNPKNGLSVQRELKDPKASVMIGKKIGEKIDGNLIGLSGFEFEITGGSDDSGFPMRKDLPGVRRKRILAVRGVGIKRKLGKGIKQRKTVCGNTIHEKIVQINLKVLKEGKEDLGFKAVVKKEKKEKPKEVKEEKPKKVKEKPKEEKPQEEKKEVKEKPKAEPKKESPKEEKK